MFKTKIPKTLLFFVKLYYTFKITNANLYRKR